MTEANNNSLPLVVVILDGWGISLIEQGNAISQANTPMMDMFATDYPTVALHAASIEAGLPWGEIGNSETGHSNIGAGHVRYQSRPRIDKAIADGDFFTNPALLGAIEHAQKNDSNLHLMGLLGPGAVHAHSDHLFALLNLISRYNLAGRIFIHVFTDGRDTPPQSATQYLTELENNLKQYQVGQIASVTGRFYAMDRNQNWERTKQTYDMLTGGPRPIGASSAAGALQQSYTAGVGDEMIQPTAITRGGGPIADIDTNDAVIFFNYRPDRARQLTRAFVDPAFTGFERPLLNNLYFATMTRYDETLPLPAAFPEDPLAEPLAKVLADAGLTQLHIAETEKYAHITYYLNGGHEQPFPNEKHLLIPSPKVTSFAELPAMSAEAITNEAVANLTQGTYDIYFINYANADMVGHTGNFAAGITACETVDRCLQQLYDATQAAGGIMLVTADHGNAEEMLNPQTGALETDHTNNPVPFHLIATNVRRQTPRSPEELIAVWSEPVGVLADVAPTILDILQLPAPSSMTGVSLLGSLQ